MFEDYILLSTSVRRKHLETQQIQKDNKQIIQDYSNNWSILLYYFKLEY